MLMRVISLSADDRWQVEIGTAPQVFFVMLPRWLLEFELWLVSFSGDVCRSASIVLWTLKTSLNVGVPLEPIELVSNWKG